MNLTKNAVLGRTDNIRSNLGDSDRQVNKIGKLILKKRWDFAVLHSWNQESQKYSGYARNKLGFIRRSFKH